MSEGITSGIFGKMLTLKDEQERVQKKTFTKWINCYLTQLRPPVLIKDIFLELSDGLLLLELLEMLTKTKLRKEKPKSMQRIHCITNVKTALEYMEIEKKIKMVNINPSDIVDGKPAIVLGLMWTLILFFQIEEQEEFLLHALGLDNDPSAKVKGMAKKALMAWSNNTLSEKYGLNLKDFGESWRDGKAFNALVHNINPDLIDMLSLQNRTNKENLENAFNIAENELGIPKLLDSEDVDVHKPDEKSIMTYVAQFLKSYPEGKKSEDTEKDIKVNELNNWEKVKEFKDHVNYCLNDVPSRTDYKVFLRMMNEKQNAKEAINNIKKEENNVEKIKEVEELLNESEIKLKNWQTEFDKKLPGELGSLIVDWLYDAENYIENPIGKKSTIGIEEELESRIKNHERIFSKKDNISLKLKNIQSNTPQGILLEQLQHIQRRIEDVLTKELEERDLIDIIVLESKLKEESNKWNNLFDYWITPLNSQDDFNIRLFDFNASTDDGNPMDTFSNDLAILIKKTSTYFKSHPPLDSAINSFLKDSVENIENANDVLPTKFENCCKEFEDLSSRWKEIEEIDTKVKNYMNKIENSVRNNDLEQQKSLSNQLTDFKDLLLIQKNTFDQNLKIHCNDNFKNVIEKKINGVNDSLQNMAEKIVENLERQEQEKVIQLQATKNASINKLEESGEMIISELNSWFEEVEKDLNHNFGSSLEELNEAKQNLEILKDKRPKIKGLIDKGYSIVKDLDSLNSPEKTTQLREKLDKSQNKLNAKEFTEFSKNISKIEEVMGLVKEIEKGESLLLELIKEGTEIKHNFENVKDLEDSKRILEKEKIFLNKQEIISSMVSNNNELLKKLKEISEDESLRINLDPLEKKIRRIEENIQNLLQNSKNSVTAKTRCDDSYNDASKALEEITRRLKDINTHGSDEIS